MEKNTREKVLRLKERAEARKRLFPAIKKEADVLAENAIAEDWLPYVYKQITEGN